MAGGHSEVKSATPEIQEIATSMKGEVESKLGAKYDKFDATHFTQQVVAGMIFHIKVATGDADAVHLRCYQPLPHTGDPIALQACKAVGLEEELSVMSPA
eukprot:CAMPEP_0116033192 /NCGR_PEP_ID=MMETSP0321-20121206/18798_1 /TAXON_ID=163516 /ORGANISM="Leptocylindrus danicus var. danicus, Strain B650" /LENGTH=99 /DNA_ID=CAMNT_0003509131 /DNA_START=181 /DNA_END=480 /DNA_ORIENTATION=+